jgi:preprotein translocase subunit SecE
MANSVAVKGAGKSEGLFARMSRFLRESYTEVVKKASWPSWSELKKSTAVVIVAVLIVGAYIALADGILSKITNPLFGLGGIPK